MELLLRVDREPLSMAGRLDDDFEDELSDKPQKNSKPNLHHLKEINRRVGTRL
jgi:hypothetical protein